MVLAGGGVRWDMGPESKQMLRWSEKGRTSLVTVILCLSDKVFFCLFVLLQRTPKYDSMR